MHYDTQNKKFKICSIASRAVISAVACFLLVPTALAAVVHEPLVPNLSPEARLEIPKIGVDAVIKDMGLTPDGAMAVPSNQVDVGWFSLGTRPGDRGSAVIGGHNSWASKPGAFARLDQLQKGDIVSVIDAKGATTSFAVRDIRTYDARDTDTSDIFQSESGIHLNLITCSGDWDPLTKSTTTRLVIFTDIVETSR
ncbi:MAG: class F sortase [Candidatus Pacebacteria bacterium]|nr:class F sortase [Candidatus Paceibacterota bacterium]